MSAKEMFERLGYVQEIWCFEDENKIDEIIYYCDFKFASNITFELNGKCIKVHRKNRNRAGWCDVPMLQAINKQVEELGWLDVKNS